MNNWLPYPENKPTADMASNLFLVAILNPSKSRKSIFKEVPDLWEVRALWLSNGFLSLERPIIFKDEDVRFFLPIPKLPTHPGEQ